MKISIEEIIKMENTILEFDYNNLPNSNMQKIMATTIRDSLNELKQRRESDLRPATKFLGAELQDQWRHIMSEYDESREALCNLLQLSKNEQGNFEQKFIEELIDLQMSCETMLAILGLNERERMDARRDVIEKNRLRGYYEDGVDDED